jgi:hypothetical protein
VGVLNQIMGSHPSLYWIIGFPATIQILKKKKKPPSLFKLSFSHDIRRALLYYNIHIDTKSRNFLLILSKRRSATNIWVRVMVFNATFNNISVMSSNISFCLFVCKSKNVNTRHCSINTIYGNCQQV